MNGLDLRVRPPRPPQAMLDGLVFMPRTIDKMRGTLPSGYPGPYLVSPGLSKIMLDLLGLDLAALRDVVVRAQSDAEVAVWVRTHADVTRYEEINGALCRFRVEHVPRDERALFDSLYPAYLRARHPRLFDLLAADDAELYPSLERE